MIYFIEYAVSFTAVLMSFVFFDAFAPKSRPFPRLAAAALSAAAALPIVLAGHSRIAFGFKAAGALVFIAVMHRLIFKAPLLRVLAADALYFAVAALAFFVTSVIISEGTVSDALNGSGDERVTVLLSSAAILSALCLAFRNQARASGGSQKQNRIFLIILLAVAAAWGIMYFYQVYTDITLFKIGTVVFILSAAVYYCVVYYFKAQTVKREAEWQERQNKLLEKALRDQEITFSQWRKNIHDYKNIILAMDSMVQNREYSELSDFLAKEKESIIRQAEYIRTGNCTVDTVINTKYSSAKQSGIPFTVNAKLPEECPLSGIDLARLLGDLIDNAIEASREEAEPFIDIVIAPVRSFFMIVVTNKCSSPSSNTQTSKADKQHHGIGLKSIRDTAEKYNGSFELTFEDSKAVATVMIPN